MDPLIWLLTIFAFSICDGQWQRSAEERNPPKDPRRGIHYHTKRHMLQSIDGDGHPEPKKQHPRQLSLLKGNTLNQRAKVHHKPPGHLTPLKEDDIDNDEVMSVAIGPPPMRPQYDKLGWKARQRNFSVSSRTNVGTTPTAPLGAINLVKDILAQVAHEFISHQVNEDFVFGQFVGQAMKNISTEHKLKFQHDILDLLVKYQNMGKKEAAVTSHPTPHIIEKKSATSTSTTAKNVTPTQVLNNETEDIWPDFKNLATIVG